MLGARVPEGDPFDFVAAYLILEDLWYIIPAEVIRGQGSIAVYPRLKKSQYAPYREAWHLLRGRAGKVGSIKACAEAMAGYAYGAESWLTPIRMEDQPGGE